MTFYSPTVLTAFHLTQTIALHSQPIEQWRFHFGFVIPNSTNSWQCCINRATTSSSQPPLSAAALSGHVTIDTRFWDGEQCIGTSRLRVYYDGTD